MIYENWKEKNEKVKRREEEIKRSWEEESGALNP